MSAATAAIIGRITLPELRRRGYDDFMLFGSLSGAGTLGLLISPSITMIVYGVAAEVLIARLFMAGVVPGIVLMLLFAFVVGAWAKVKRGSVPDENDISFGWKVRFQGAVKLLPVVRVSVRFASPSRIKSGLLLLANRRRRVLEETYQVGLPSGVGFGINALQVGTKGRLTDAEQVSYFLSAKSLREC